MGTKDGTNGGPPWLRATPRRSPPISTDRGEQALGAAYDLGREAVAAQLSVLDLADAHHDALAGRARRRRGDAATPRPNFLRESLSTFETVHRGYLEVQEVARLEHEYVEQLRALADASVAINSLADRRGDPAADGRHRARDHPRGARDGRRSSPPTRACAR